MKKLFFGIVVFLAMVIMGCTLDQERSSQTSDKVIEVDVPAHEIYFPNSTISVSKNERISVPYGVYNTKDDPLLYQLRMKGVQDLLRRPFNAESWVIFDTSEGSLKPNDKILGEMTITVGNVEDGTYLLAFEVWETDTEEMYDFRDFFVTVKS